MARKKVFKYESEAEMCRAYTETVKDADPDPRNRWTIYPETAGYDFIMVRACDGLQIGVEAKQALNAHVLAQAARDGYQPRPGPDHRAVLVPATVGVKGTLELARLLGITVIRAFGPDRSGVHRFSPALPRAVDNRGYRITRQEYRRGADWMFWYPPAPLELPDYVPDVPAGVKGPAALTLWKVKAIKLLVVLTKVGHATRKDFHALDMSPSIWLQRGWLKPSSKRGIYMRGNPPDFAAQHKVNYAEIEADFDSWATEDMKNRAAVQRFN